MAVGKSASARMPAEYMGGLKFKLLAYAIHEKLSRNTDT
jgi:hypothetical protein